MILPVSLSYENEIPIHLLQGESEVISENFTLGRATITRVEFIHQEIGEIEVSLEIDINGILHLSARDRLTRHPLTIRVDATNGLSKNDIDNYLEKMRNRNS